MQTYIHGPDIHRPVQTRKMTLVFLSRKREWSDGSTFNYHNWKSGQPHNVRGEQSCTTTHLGNAGLWSVEECSKRRSFICYGTNGEKVQEIHQDTQSVLIALDDLMR